jgi:hypothetical protein
MKKFLIGCMFTLLSVMLAACLQNHQNGAQEFRGDDCVACHLDDYQRSPHGTNRPNTCGDCHSQLTWLGGTEGHPEAKFPVKNGAHQGIECTTCHIVADGPYTAGANVSCINSGCHPDADISKKHRDVTDYSFNAANKHFCLRCHPDGRN